MNPYSIDINKLKESKEILDEKELIKLKLVQFLLKATSKMSTEDILNLTGLHKADLSRLRTLSLGRFTIDRIVGLLDQLGFSTKVDVRAKKVS